MLLGRASFRLAMWRTENLSAARILTSNRPWFFQHRRIILLIRNTALIRPKKVTLEEYSFVFICREVPIFPELSRLQRRGERRATINEELWGGGVYVRERFISQSEHTPKYVY